MGELARNEFLRNLHNFITILIFSTESKSVSRPLDARCIGNFPDEILIEIFTYLSVNELKRLMMVNHVYRDLVGQSTKLMKKFLLKISPKRKWDFESLADFERVHQNVKMMEFKTESDSLSKVIDGLMNIGANVKHFEMNDSEVTMENLLTVLSTNETSDSSRPDKREYR